VIPQQKETQRYFEYTLLNEQPLGAGGTRSP
jgi:hypothetical protein